MTVKRTTRWAGAATIAAASALTLGALASPALADTNPNPESGDNNVAEPEEFTGAYIVDATPDQVIPDASNNPAGVDGAEGQFIFLTDSVNEVICWDIAVTGLATDYESMAKTATHIHQTPAGENGPPRIAFPDPEPEEGAELDDADALRTSGGCAEGPFTTGLAPEGTDTGAGFELATLEENPAGFSADTHTTDAVSGAVRGQLVFSQELLDEVNGVDEEAPAPGDDDDAADDDRQVPVGGVRTGEGGSASTLPVGLLAAFTVGGAGLAGAAVLRRRQSA